MFRNQDARPTFWETFTPEERKQSVNAARARHFGDRQFAWNAAGRMLAEFATYVYPEVILPIIQDRSSEVFRGVPKECVYSAGCWMVGDNYERTHPAAMIVCADLKVARNAVQVLEKHSQLRQLGFSVHEYLAR
ncbi:hypothetical protein N7492_008361 [Penicillium capsulatum]|uniref:Uncharacterized protein n=1 Tax=Penicillium capsulatum TaxID=69766 RepID=A0A9W9HPK2_9EURO|nr:hypothetical protein N7492_008361 [Penicillium capsulatum]KAJ6105763.1 hypothetical protein N7512_009280 [Penicillium capsulatum]